MTKPRIRLLLVDDSLAAIEVLIAFVNLAAEHEDHTPDFWPAEAKHFIFEAIATPTVEMALRLLRNEGPFDVVLTDIGMYPLSGFALLKAIRAGESFGPVKGTSPNIVVGACTGAMEENDRRRYEEEGFDFYLCKAAEIKDIINQCLWHLERKRGQNWWREDHSELA